MPQQKGKVGLREVRVGLFIVVSIVVLIFLLLNASGDISPFARRIHLRARFPNADGLRRGSDVMLAGVRVGKVDKLTLLDPSDVPDAPKVEAVFEVDSEIGDRPAQERIRTDSVAQLSSPSLLGNDKVINIIPGTSLADPVHENSELKSVSEGGIDQLTQTGNEVGQQLNTLTKQLNDVVTKINQGQGTIGRLLNDEAFYNNLNRTLLEAQGTISEIRSGNGTAAKLLNDPALYNNLNTISAQVQAIATDLQRGRGTAGKLLTDDQLYNEARSTITRLNGSVDQINSIVGDLRAGRGTAGKLLTDEAIYNDARTAIARFNTSAERIDNIISNIQRGEGTAGKLVTDDQLYSNVNQLSSESVKLLYDFRQNPKKYLTIHLNIF